jgi:hypothetical protein
MSGRRGFFLALVAVSLLAAATADARTIQIPSYEDAEASPGGAIRALGEGWVGRSSGCRNEIKLTLTDSGGRRRSAGRLVPDQFQPANAYGSIQVPVGTRPGAATVRGVQRISFRVPIVNRCLQFARKQSPRLRITVLGAHGNDAPVISDAAASAIRQRRAGTISWNVSEPGRTTISLAYEFNAARTLAIGTILDEDRPAGQNSLNFDGTWNGQALPAGAYEVLIRHTDSSGASAAPVVLRFAIGYGE